MAILITGGTGFVALNLAEALVARGERVALFAADPPPPPARAAFERLSGRVIAELGDVRDQPALERLMQAAEIDQIVHAAAVAPGPARERRDARAVLEVNLLGTLALLQAAERHPIRRVVLLSSAAVYGVHAFRQGALDEDTPALPDGIYGTSKFAAERVALRTKALSGLDVVVARLGPVFGPWESQGPHRDLMSAPYQALVLAIEGRPIVLPRPGLRDWVYSRDAADGIVRLLDAHRLAHEVYHVGSGARWSVEDWCGRLARRYPGTAFGVSPDPTAATVDFGAASDPAALAIDRIADELGFRPRFDLDAAFADYMRWLDS